MSNFKDRISDMISNFSNHNNSSAKSNGEDFCLNQRGAQYQGEYTYKELESRIDTKLTRLKQTKGKPPLSIMNGESRQLLKKNSSQPIIIRNLQPKQEKSIMLIGNSSKEKTVINDANQMSNNFKKYYVEGNHSRNKSYLNNESSQLEAGSTICFGAEKKSFSSLHKSQSKCDKVLDNLIYNSNIFAFKENPPKQVDINPIKIVVDTKNTFLQKLVTTVCLDYNAESYSDKFGMRLKKTNELESFLPPSTRNNAGKQLNFHAYTIDNPKFGTELNEKSRNHATSISKLAEKSILKTSNNNQIKPQIHKLTTEMHTLGNSFESEIINKDYKKNGILNFNCPSEDRGGSNPSIYKTSNFTLKVKPKPNFSSIDASLQFKNEEVGMETIRFRHKLEKKLIQSKEKQLSYDPNWLRKDFNDSANRKAK